VIVRSPDNARACEILYGLAMPLADPRIVAVANKNCRAIESTHEQRVVLARAMLADHHADEVVGLLGDVEGWRGRVDDKIEAWFLLCDAYRDTKQWADAKHCLRRLDASGGLTPARAAEVQQRMATLDHARAEEVGSQQPP
jgi:hypothetical protein